MGDRVSEDTLRQKLQGNYALALEVTNGLVPGEFGFKVNQALWGQRYLQRLAPDANVEAGLIFVRNEAAINARSHDLDFLGQIRAFRQQRAISALESAIKCEYLIEDKAQFTSTARAFIDLVRTAIPLYRLFYPNQREVQALLQRFPGLQLPQDAREYKRAIADLKGVVLEEYTRLMLVEMIPKADITSRQIYRRKRSVMDIDHVVIGDENEIKRALRNSNELVKYSTEETHRKERFHKRVFVPGVR